jgi:hypothetical protein
MEEKDRLCKDRQSQTRQFLNCIIKLFNQIRRTRLSILIFFWLSIY